jgi:hypothetical protein
MTSRELLLKTFNCQPTSRIPISPFIHENFIKAFFDKNDIDVVEKTPEVYEYFGFDLMHRNCTPDYNPIEYEGEDWKVEKRIETIGESETTVTIIETPEGILNQVYKVRKVSVYDFEKSPVEYLIKTKGDFLLCKKYQPQIHKIDIASIKRAKIFTKERGVIAPWIHGVFNYVAYYYRKLDDLLIDALTDEEFYREMMEYFLEQNKRYADQLIDAGVDILSYAGNIANSKIISPEFFRRYILEYEKTLIDYIQSRGVIVLYHNCGYARALLPIYNELNVKAYESLTPPPYGDTILEEALNILSPQITLLGNIDQISLLRYGSPKEIREKVKETLYCVKKRGNFILATTDYLQEDTPYENIFALANAGKEFGEY